MSTSNTRTPELQEGQLNDGIKSSRANIGVAWGLDESTLNAHVGQYDGIGPRHGMAPLPLHNHNVASPALNDVLSLQVAERPNVNISTQKRVNIYGIAQTSFNSQVLGSIPGKPFSGYFFITALTDPADSTKKQLAFHHTAQLVSQTTVGAGASVPHYPAEFLDTGLSGFVHASYAGNIWSALQTSRSLVTNTKDQFTLDSDLVAIASSVFRKSGSQVQVKSLLMGTSAVTPTTHGPLYFRSQDGNYGTTRQFMERSFKSTLADYSIEDYATTAFSTSRVSTWTGFTGSLASISSEYLELPGVQLTPGTGTSSNPATRSNTYSLIKSKQLVIDNSFEMICVAARGALCAVFQPWLVSPRETTLSKWGNNFQLIDLSSGASAPPITSTTDGGASYSENQIIKRTCWDEWRSYTTTAVPTDPGAATRTNQIYLRGANTGILRASRTYEFTFSYYDASIDHETNVGVPALILTGTNDYTSFLLWGGSIGVVPYRSKFPMSLFANRLDNNVTNNVGIVTDRYNFLSVRFYYRERGTFEWLPCGSYTLPDLHDADNAEIVLCEGPFVGRVGGQPGGFNDYSVLAKDKYTTTLSYRSRLFWMSDRSMVFSNLNDPFSYAVGNAVTCPKGQFLGMLPHTYPGQAEQASRLVIFGSEEVYAARFRGTRFARQQSVRVSSDSIGAFPVDGSDFFLDVWTSHTAFSSRSAVVAQGVLYWWGPTGIYRDVGNELPVKDFSAQMEPLIFDLYDPQRTGEIHTVYNDVTKEIIWFYPPNPKLSGVQKALVYKTKDQSFFLWDFGNTIIDDAQNLVVQLSNTNSRSNAGMRILLHIRDSLNTFTPQRTVFFDDLCDSGDVTVNTTFMCNQVSVAGVNRRLTFASGYSATLPISGALTVVRYRDYRDTLTTNPDGIYTIVGGDGGSYIDIAPIGSWTGVDFLIETITDAKRFFPVFIESLNGFNFNVTSQYWAPFGWRFWGRWLYCYQSYRVQNLLRSSGQTVQLNFQSILGTGASPRIVTLANNSRGNCQVHSQIIFAQQNADGQAMAITLTTPSGKANGSRWYLQYLSYDVTELPKNNFKHWEG